MSQVLARHKLREMGRRANSVLLPGPFKNCLEVRDGPSVVVVQYFISKRLLGSSLTLSA